MKARSKIFSKAILCVLMAALTLALSVSAAATTNSTTLTTSVPASFSLLLEIQGRGTVTINSQTYTESGTILIPRNMDVTLQIIPEQGSYIESVLYNGSKITSTLVDGSVTLPAMNGDSTLVITFAASQNPPQTGDQAARMAVLAEIAMLLSLCCLALVWKSKNRFTL